MSKLPEGRKDQLYREVPAHKLPINPAPKQPITVNIITVIRGMSSKVCIKLRPSFPHHLLKVSDADGVPLR